MYVYRKQQGFFTQDYEQINVLMNDHPELHEVLKAQKIELEKEMGLDRGYGFFYLKF